MRPLSVRGRAEVELLAREAAARGARPGVIWHSGKLRARQTAEAYWRACNPLAAFVAVRGLQPADPPTWIVDGLLAEEGEVMVVGHMPHLPALLRALVAGNPDPESMVPAHGVVCLERQGTHYVERWRVAPGDLT
jgi:phosphohistidine phosphatase